MAPPGGAEVPHPHGSFSYKLPNRGSRQKYGKPPKFLNFCIFAVATIPCKVTACLILSSPQPSRRIVSLVRGLGALRAENGSTIKSCCDPKKPPDFRA